MDDYDFIDEKFNEPPKGVFDNTENVFPIIGFGNDEPNDFSLGTGFFINENGYFLTAGHVVIDKTKSYFAIINKERYKFEIVFIEYVDKEKQDVPICRDLAICRLIDLNSTIPEDYSFIFNSDEDKIVFYSGYQMKSLPSRITYVEIDDEKKVSLYKLKDKDIKLKEQQRKILVCNGEFSDKRPICDNVKSLKEERIVKGMSGAPIYFEKSVFGMLIGDCYILSEYIVEKLNKYKIQYKSE